MKKKHRLFLVGLMIAAVGDAVAYGLRPTRYEPAIVSWLIVGVSSFGFLYCLFLLICDARRNKIRLFGKQ